jgi:nitrogen fixation NifU-like protein
MSEQVIGRTIPEALEVAEGFRRLMHEEGSPDEELLGDGIAFAGVARYPVRVKCALLGWMAFKDAVVRAVEGIDGGQTLHQEDGDQATAAKARKLPGEA